METLQAFAGLSDQAASALRALPRSNSRRFVDSRQPAAESLGTVGSATEREAEATSAPECDLQSQGPLLIQNLSWPLRVQRQLKGGCSGSILEAEGRSALATETGHRPPFKLQIHKGQQVNLNGSLGLGKRQSPSPCQVWPLIQNLIRGCSGQI